MGNSHAHEITKKGLFLEEYSAILEIRGGGDKF